MAPPVEIVGFQSECWGSDDDESAALTQTSLCTKDVKEAKKASESNGAVEANGVALSSSSWGGHRPLSDVKDAEKALESNGAVEANGVALSSSSWGGRRPLSVVAIFLLGVLTGACLSLIRRPGSAGAEAQGGLAENPATRTLQTFNTTTKTFTTTQTFTTTVTKWVRDPKCSRSYEDHNFRWNAKLGWCVDTRCKKPNQRYSIFLKVCQDRGGVGRIDKLFGMMVEHGLDWTRVTQNMWPLGTPFLDREGILWHIAVAEENLDPRNISGWGRNAPKFPRSWLPRFLGLNQTKRYRYNFQGGGMDLNQAYAPQYEHRRKWTTEFAKAHFDARDLLRWTDVPVDGAGGNNGKYKRQGVYDYSGLPLPGGFILRQVQGEKGHNDIQFDDFYFGSMAASNFTVAPGGDGPCTLRFYEAIAAGSIPLVPAQDAPGVGCHCPYSYIPYTYATDENLFEHNASIAAENFRLFVKYQTFTEGDHVPRNAPSKF